MEDPIKEQDLYKFEPWQEEIVNEYIKNDAIKLQKLIYPLLISTGGINQMEYDDYIGKSTDLLCKLLKTYDESTGVPFHNFFKSCLQKRFQTWANRDANRLKRKNHVVEKDENGNEKSVFVNDTSIDTPIGIGDFTIGDTIEDKINVATQVFEEVRDENVKIYFDSLSYLQKKIIELKIDGYLDSEIKEKLNISKKKHSKLWLSIRSYEKTQHIYSNNNIILEDKKMDNQTKTLETNKKDTIYVRMLMKKMDNRTIKFNHVLQRRSGRWTPIMRSKLMSDILQNNPFATSLVFAEQVVNGSAIIWDLDGKQKCTTIHQFIKNEFKISRKMVEERRWNIKYDIASLDENGKELLENGFPMNEHKEFDIRGKYFKDLPDELKDRIEAYSFDVLQYFNCTEDDIAYHIERHNEGKQMNTCEKGLIKLGGKYASFVKDISDMSLFTELGEYTSAELNNGTTDRVVIESIMAMKYISDWAKSQDEICTYLKENATEEDFEDFESIVSDLEELVETRKEITGMFNSKNSFLWFSLYSKFKKYDLANDKFADFLVELTKSLHCKEVNNITYDSLCFDEDGKPRATKDKYIVIPKIELLEKLMLDYLHINKEESQSEEQPVLDFVRENVGQVLDVDEEGNDILRDINEKDLDAYDDLLNCKDGLIDKAFLNNINSKCLEKENEKSLIAIIAYAFQNDISIHKWFVDYFKRNNTYLHNQKENYEKMRDDLEKYILQKEKVSA